MPGPGDRPEGARVTFQQADAGGFTQRWEREKRGGWEEVLTATYTRR
jgi:hypothetical protein